MKKFRSLDPQVQDAIKAGAIRVGAALLVVAVKVASDRYLTKKHDAI